MKALKITLTYVLLAIILFFFGTLLSFHMGKAEGQGLAGAPIIMGFGLLAVIFGWIVFSIIIVKFGYPNGYWLNIVLFLISLLLVFILNMTGRTDSDLVHSGQSWKFNESNSPQQALPFLPQTISMEEAMNPLRGMGVFKPDYRHFPTLLLFSGSEHSLHQATVQDSIVFNSLPGQTLAITYAPPYLYPLHMKLDYDVLFFTVLGVERNYLKIEVNQQTRQIAYVERHSGVLQYWPDFFLDVHSVDWIEGYRDNCYSKPLTHAALIEVDYQLMKPIEVEGDWMQVALLNDQLKPIRKAWIQWRKDGEIKIDYSLLS